MNWTAMPAKPALLPLAVLTLRVAHGEAQSVTYH